MILLLQKLKNPVTHYLTKISYRSIVLSHAKMLLLTLIRNHRHRMRNTFFSLLVAIGDHLTVQALNNDVEDTITNHSWAKK